MAKIVIRDLEKCVALDRAAMHKIQGGSAYSQYVAAQRRRGQMQRYRRTLRQKSLPGMKSLRAHTFCGRRRSQI